MKKYGKRAVGLLVLCGMFLCFWRSTANLRDLEQNTRMMIVYEENKQQYTGSYADELIKDNARQEEPLNFTFWGGQGMDVITGVGLERTVSCYILAVCGNSQNIYPDAPALLYGDGTGCLISEGTAWELFGENRVKGLKVQYQGITYTVIGVIRQQQPLFLYETSSEYVTGLNHVSIENESENYLTEPYRSFMARYGEGFAYDYGFLSGLLKWTLGIFMIVIILALERITIRSYRKWEGYQKYILILPGIAAALAGICFFCTHFQVASDLFPAVWSDFDAWKEIADRSAQRTLVLFCDTKEPFMFCNWISFAKGLAWSTGCYISYIVLEKIR